MKRTEDLQTLLLGHATTIEATYYVAKMAIELNIPGDFVECGVFAGAQSAAMARAIQDTGASKRVHMFDSFEGIPAPGPNDRHFREVGHQAGEACCSIDLVKTYMKNWRIPDGLLVYHPGWFEETFPAAASTLHIAVLRMDGDLYESTKSCMRWLYPRVVPGGWVIADDYQLDGCEQAVREQCGPAPIYWRKN